MTNPPSEVKCCEDCFAGTKDGKWVCQFDFKDCKCHQISGEKKGRNIGALRQWLNERTEKRLITNEDIETFLNL